MLHGVVIAPGLVCTCSSVPVSGCQLPLCFMQKVTAAHRSTVSSPICYSTLGKESRPEANRKIYEIDLRHFIILN